MGIKLNGGSYQPSRKEIKLGINYSVINQQKKKSSNKKIAAGTVEPVIATPEYVAVVATIVQDKKIADLQDNISPPDPAALFQVGASVNMALQGTVILTAWELDSNSFALDHPVYGELDSAALALDGNYKQWGTTFPWTWTAGHDWGDYNTYTILRTIF